MLETCCNIQMYNHMYIENQKYSINRNLICPRIFNSILISDKNIFRN